MFYTRKEWRSIHWAIIINITTNFLHEHHLIQQSIYFQILQRYWRYIYNLLKDHTLRKLRHSIQKIWALHRKWNSYMVYPNIQKLHARWIMTDTWLSDRKINVNSHCALSKHNHSFSLYLCKIHWHCEISIQKRKRKKKVWPFNLLAINCNFHTSALNNKP